MRNGSGGSFEASRSRRFKKTGLRRSTCEASIDWAKLSNPGHCSASSVPKWANSDSLSATRPMSFSKCVFPDPNVAWR